MTEQEIREIEKYYDRPNEPESVQAKHVRALIAEVRRLRPSAERYEWLRAQHWSAGGLAVTSAEAVKLGHDCPSGERLDSAVDAARGALPPLTSASPP